jgi:hypothetical protein
MKNIEVSEEMARNERRMASVCSHVAFRDFQYAAQLLWYKYRMQYYSTNNITNLPAILD